MDVSSEGEDIHIGQEDESDCEDGVYTGSQASEGSPQAKTGKGPSGTRARKWFPVAQCSGWEEAQVAMHKLSVQQMSGAALHKGTVSATQGFLTYRFRCPFHGSHNCNWLCRVSIPLAGDATNAVAQKTPAEQRQYHANHRCSVEVDGNFQHVDHAGPQSKGPHMLFVLEAQTTNEMWSWRSRRIQQWMQDRQIALSPNDDVKMFLNRLRRHSQRAREAKDKELFLHRDQIARYFHLPQPAAAKILKVSVSTLRRRCKELGIGVWPFNTWAQPVSPVLDAQRMAIAGLVPVQLLAHAAPSGGQIPHPSSAFRPVQRACAQFSLG